MVDSELTIRGIIDKLIDNQLNDVDLAMTHMTFEAMKYSGAIRGDRRDAVFGFIMGTLQSNFGALFRLMFNRNPNTDEVAIAVEVYQKNIYRIKSRIDETFT